MLLPYKSSPSSTYQAWASRCAAFCLANSGQGSVLPAEDSSFFSRSPLAGSASPHRKARAAVLLKAEMDYVFRRPTQASHHRHHSEAWRRTELEH